MEDHDWMQSVLIDLETYAAKNGLNRLECMLGQARSTANLEIAAIKLQEHYDTNAPKLLRLN